MSYDSTWNYLRKLSMEANFTDKIKTGRWLWVYDNVNLHMKVHHEREGTLYRQTQLHHQYIKIYTLFSMYVLNTSFE